MKFAYSILGLLVLIVLGVAPVQATVVTSLPDGTIINMPVVNYFGPGPQVFGPGITWSSTNATTQGGSVFGWNGGYVFSGNGNWNDPLIVMAGLNDSYDVSNVTDTMTFEFDAPVSAVGGFLNYVPGGSTPTTIAVYDVNSNLIESFDLTFTTSGLDNTGFFYGFQESDPIVKSFTLTDNYIGITDLTITSPVPEPTSIVLFGTGLCVMGFAAFRRKRR